MGVVVVECMVEVLGMMDSLGIELVVVCRIIFDFNKFMKVLQLNKEYLRWARWWEWASWRWWALYWRWWTIDIKKILLISHLNDLPSIYKRAIFHL